MAVDKENEFGLDSSDEEEVLQLTLNIENPTLKRKAPTDLSISNKRPVFAGTNDVPTYPERSEAAVQILKCRFGKEKFLLKQEAVIARLLHGGSAVVVFPTGGGKSLCFQIPALGLDGGITLVISPLIALMKDQVDALLQRGIKAAVMDSTKTTEQHLETCRALRAGEIRLLYCAPERLNNEGFVDQMERVRGGIRLVAIDEAHCISEWGHAFRPDYLKLSRFVKEVKAERVVCLTATATPKVAQDICNAFDIDQSGLFRASSYRSNLQLLAESAPTKQALYSKLFNFLKGNPGPTIVYVTLQKQTEALADDLRKKGFKAHSFHAGMATKEKTKLQDDFMKANDLIIVATVCELGRCFERLLTC
jgi:RecQ family ATP-dependent DNA helicase